MNLLPRILIIGGPDVDSRIPIIQELAGQFAVSVYGSSLLLVDAFNKVKIPYSFYYLNRGVNPLLDIYTILYLMYVIRKVKPDIVHTFDTKPAILARLAARLVNVPFVIGTIPGLGILYSRNDFYTRFIRSIYKPLQKLSCYFSDLTIFQNSDDAEQFIRDGLIGREKTCIVLGSGVDIQRFNPEQFGSDDRKRIRKSLNLDESNLIVTMVSRLIRSKGVLEFSQTAQVICAKYPKVVFLLIGADDNGSMDELLPFERDMIINTTTWLGIRADIPELMAISNIFVFPTYYREGIPRVLLEAAAMSLPIVTTQTPGCTEVVKDNQNGILVPVCDVFSLTHAVEKLIKDSVLREKFGSVSRHLAVSRFNTSMVAKHTASIYNQLITGSKYGK